MNKWKKILLIVIGLLCCIVIAFFPFPVKIDGNVKKLVVSHALNAVIENKAVVMLEGYTKLYDSHFVEDNGQLYFRNKFAIPDVVFLEHHLKPTPTDRKLKLGSGNVIISFSHEIEATEKEGLYFSYVFGSLGGQGYRIKVYKSLMMYYFVYEHEWES